MLTQTTNFVLFVFNYIFYFFYYIQLIAVYIVLFTIELASLSGKTGTRSVVCIWNIDLYKQIWLQLDEILKNYRCLTIKVATPTKVCQLITEKKFQVFRGHLIIIYTKFGEQWKNIGEKAEKSMFLFYVFMLPMNFS